MSFKPGVASIKKPVLCWNFSCGTSYIGEMGDGTKNIEQNL